MGYHLVFMGSGEGFRRRQKSMKGDYGKVTASVGGGGGGGRISRIFYNIRGIKEILLSHNQNSLTPFSPPLPLHKR